jgi:iron complex outermembrane receptor protein
MRQAARATVFAACLAAGCNHVACGEEDPPQADVLHEITVISTTPLPGTGIDIAKIPGNVESLDAAALTENGTASMTGALSDTLADPYQQDILYRGFEASPVIGAPQGLAVYQNGVRINEAFGDAVNWDLVPDFAIHRVDLVSSNPSFGLNALGGAVAITMKNAFNFHGAAADLSGGSFDQRTGTAEYAVNDGRFGAYVGARVLSQGGWRLFAHDSLHQFYASLGARNDASSLDLNYSRAYNQLFGQGAAPVQELAISRRLVFTGPQENYNSVDFVTLDGAHTLNGTLAVQGVLYARNYRQSVSNGNTTEYTACAAPEQRGALCQPDAATPLVDTAGAVVPDLSAGGSVHIGENDFEALRADGVGGSVQLGDSQALFGRGNQFTVGFAVDSARVDFSSGAELGVIDPQLLVRPSPYFVDTPEGTPFPATPVDLRATNLYEGLYATDTFDLTAAIAVTASARYNTARVDLADQRGTQLDGDSRFSHFNPAIGATYALSPRVSAYANYAVTNRTPTASEIECSDPAKPCLLPANLAGDPPTLRQVVARSFEFGIRRRAGAAERDALQVNWNASVFRSDLDDDIAAIATSIASGFFQNIGATRRQGIEAAVDLTGARGSAYLQYSLVDATYRSAFLESSTSNPFADANGNIQVLAGDRLPGIPRQRVKLGGSVDLAKNWSVGGEFVLVGPQFYRGDESNQNGQLAGYHVLNLRTAVRINPQIELYATVKNAFDARYATFALFSDPTGVGAPGIPAGAVSNGPGVDTRFVSPAAPRAYFAGIRLRF